LKMWRNLKNGSQKLLSEENIFAAIQAITVL
jgi:hypothetical protein